MSGASCAKLILCGANGASCVTQGVDLVRLSVQTYENKSFTFSEKALLQVIENYDKIEALADASLAILLKDIGWVPPKGGGG